MAIQMLIASLSVSRVPALETKYILEKHSILDLNVLVTIPWAGLPSLTEFHSIDNQFWDNLDNIMQGNGWGGGVSSACKWRCVSKIVYYEHFYVFLLKSPIILDSCSVVITKVYLIWA